jgi:hypothetical protein
LGDGGAECGRVFGAERREMSLAMPNGDCQTAAGQTYGLDLAAFSSALCCSMRAAIFGVMV